MKNINIAVILIGLIIPIVGYTQPIQLEPIVLVPGIMGSWNSEVMFQGSGSGDWNFFPIDHHWDNMISALEDAGYQQGVNLFVSFYDWRQSNINSATDYLIPTIDKALLNSPTGKVNIIAHSMGGLVARRYIESNQYRNDVDHLIMLGTPNYGSSDVYTLWEGGRIPDNWGRIEQFIINGYLWYITVATAQMADNYDTIHTFIPSIRELLPTYDFLTDSEGGVKSYWNLAEASNPFLDNLNESDNVHKLLNLGHITVIAGQGQGTVGDVPVIDRPEGEPKLWADGMPEPLTPERNDTDGDNRVLLSSAFLNESAFIPPVLVDNFWQRLLSIFMPKVHAEFDGDLDAFLDQVEVDGKHGALPTLAIPQILDTLGLPQPTIAYVAPEEPDHIVGFWFASPIAVKVTDPSGRVITKDSNNIPEAVYTGETDPNGVKMVIIPNGLVGKYKVELLGIGDGEYHMAATTFTDGADKIVTVEKSVLTGEKIEYEVDINPGASLVAIGEPIITMPEPENNPSPLEMAQALQLELDKYYQDKKITNKGLYQSLSTDLKLVIKSLEVGGVIVERLAIHKIQSFIFTLESKPNKNKIDLDALSDLIVKARAILTKI